ncbi:MAG: acyl-CoA dehydrogenase family protein [Microbacteriaceae bacterium]
MTQSEKMTTPAPRPQGITHTVTNQVPPRTNVNEFLEFPVLHTGVQAFGGSGSEADLVRIGELVGSEAFQADAEKTNIDLPRLETHDRYGNRRDRVIYTEAYHRVISAAVKNGAHTGSWASLEPGSNIRRAASFMMFAQVEPGHACPISMTNAAIPSIQLNPALAKRWIPRAKSHDYSPELGSRSDPLPNNAPKTSALFGMAMTEKQGGSDVRANSTVASKAAEGIYWLSGHKWFCSAPMSDAFLVLAKIDSAAADTAPSCFLVPRVLDDGSENIFRIQRLKDKVGNRSNASSEIELDGTIGYLVGEPGRGVAAIIEMVTQTRLDCVYGSAAGMRQSLSEALWHARHRQAFGAKLAEQPAMSAVLADLALESEASTLLALRLAAAHESNASASDVSFRRIATAIAKYWVCKRGPNHAYEAMECLGGNGYTEAFAVSRRYREQPVMAIWEGSGNVIALDVLRALTRDPDSAEAFRNELLLARGQNALYDQHLSRLELQLMSLNSGKNPEKFIRKFVESAALALQAKLMLEHAPANSSSTFIAARLGTERSFEYGALSSKSNFEDILARHELAR